MQKENQLNALRAVLDTGVLNIYQQDVLRKLIFATENGSERAVAAYISTMDDAASFWAVNNREFVGLLGG